MEESKKSRGGGKPAGGASPSPTDMTDKPSYWAVLVAPVLFDPELPDFSKLLYAVITSLTDQTGFCWASNAYFARNFRKASRTVQRSLKELQDAGYIRIEDGTGGQGRRKIFAGIPVQDGNRDKNVTVTTTEMSPPHDKNVTQNKKGNKKKNNPPLPPEGRGADYVPKKEPVWKPGRFAGFWDYYPNHKSKQDAIKAWDQLKPSDELIAVIGKALRRQKASEQWTKPDPRIPYAATYLRQALWTDPIDDKTRPSQQEELPWI